MAFMQIEYNSEVLKQYRQIDVIYPDASEFKDNPSAATDIPVLYLLHGMNGNQNSWNARTNIQRLVRHTNLVVVMPCSDNAWYADTDFGWNYYEAIANELPRVLRHFFPNMTTKREKTFIAGLSMGGYGAFKIALTTNQYAWVGSFSGALFTEKGILSHVQDNQKYWQGIFGELTTDNLSRHTIPHFATMSDKKTKMYAWCGKEDFLFDINEEAAQELKKLGLDLDYQTAHGTHDWYYWEQQVERFLEMLPIDYVKEERLS